MGALLVLVGFGGLIFGLMNLVRPMGWLKVTTRGTAGLVSLGSFVVLALGGALLPPSEETPIAAEASTTTVAPSSTTSDASIDIVEIAFDAPGNDNENLNGEWITVFNNGDSSVEMTGWGLHDASATNRYTFPPGFTLAAGATVSVFSGCGEDSDDALYWCSQGSGVWNNEGDTVFVTDPSGNRHTSQMYEPPTTTTTNASTNNHFLNQQWGRQL